MASDDEQPGQLSGIAIGPLLSRLDRRLPFPIESPLKFNRGPETTDSVDGKLTCPVDVTHELTAFVNPILNLFGCCWPCGHVVEGEQSPCCAATRGQRSRSAERIVHMSIGLPVAKRFQAARRA